MNEENNELNDIILNRNEHHHARKKMFIGIGTLAIVLIVIIIIMGRISSSTPSQLPQPMLPSETVQSEDAALQPASAPADDALDDQLSAVAEKVKEEMPPATEVAAEEEIVVVDENTAVQSMPAAPAGGGVKSAAETAQKPAAAAAPASGSVFIQVGSFSRYEPNKNFLDKIRRSGYDYTFHRVVIDGQIKNKVLVGPFKDRSVAKRNLTDVRKKIEPDAFIYTIK